MSSTAVTSAPEGQVTEQNPIINDAFSEPAHHWEFGPGEPMRREGRRLSGYLPPVTKDGQLTITDQVIVMEHVNTIRGRVKDWREQMYPGATAITRELFDRWFDPENEVGARPFFAQREAIETIAFLTEAPSDRLVGIDVPRTEDYVRWAVKLATGTGKTLVMSMVIVWSGLNKAANKQDTRFSDAFLVVCPNLTVKERLSGADGLDPTHPDSAYPRFNLIPGNFSGLFGQVRVMVTNWHQLAEETDPKRSVVKRGEESDAAFCKRVLRPLGSKTRITVMNDEAHHAWRPPPALHLTGEEKKEAEQATVWLRGLEKIHRDRGILRALDFSATPMYPGALKEKAWQPFEWIVSDFALVDAIESGLVKIPRIPTDDNSGRAVPKYRNLWEHVKSRLPRRGEDSEGEHPLTDYLNEVDGPLKQLSGEWEDTFKRWRAAGKATPPVMIVVCNDTKMAELLEKHIAEYGEAGEELRNNGQKVTLRIDSKLLGDAEARDEAESQQDAAERIRRVVGSVGKEGEPGEQIRCLISVAMLSEGWDARNVTQILGLRAFQSQLLCEQVVGRGLRRTDYTDLTQPEYVDVYGVPFQLLPFAKAGGGTIIDPPPTTQVHTVRDRVALRLQFPRVNQIVHDVGDTLQVDWDSITPVRVEAQFDPTDTWVEFEVGGKGLGGESHDRGTAYARFRPQSLQFRIAGQMVNSLGKPWLFPQALKIVGEAVRVQRKVEFGPGVDERELCNLRYVSQLRERLMAALRAELEGVDRLVPVLDQYEPLGSTDRIAFSTAKPCEPTTKSHISHVVADSKLELGIARELEHDARVVAYAKNDRLFLEIPYRHLGRTLRYRPDFIVKLANDRMLLLEGKGRADEKDDAKETAAKRWIAAVNSWGKLGVWSHHVIYNEAATKAVIDKACTGDASG